MASKAEELLKAARQKNQTHIDPITGGDVDEDNGAMEDILASLQSETETAAAPTIPVTTIEEAVVPAPAVEAPAVEAPAVEAPVEHKSMAGVRTMSRTQAELARGREALAGVKAARAHTEAMSSRTVITDADEDKDGEEGRAKVEGRAKARK